MDKTDQDSWPTVGDKGKSKEEILGNIDAVSEKENWGEKVSTFGDSLDAVIDGMDAIELEEAAGTGLLNSGKLSQSNSDNSEKDVNVNCNDLAQNFDTQTQTWSKTPGKDGKLKDNSENLSNSWDESASGWNENISGKRETTSGWNEGASALTQNASGWESQPEVSDKWKAVGKPGNKTETAPNEETGWGESAANKRNSGSNWGSSWSAQGLSLTGTEIWDQSDEKGTGDKGSDWLQNSGDSKGNPDTGWDTVGQAGGDDGQDNWNSWSTAGSKRNKVRRGFDSCRRAYGCRIFLNCPRLHV